MNDLFRRALMLPEQASTFAREVDLLHYFVITVTMLGAALVGLFVLIFIIYYRASRHRGTAAPDYNPETPHSGIPGWLEVSVAGGLLALFLLWWVIGFRQFVRIQAPPPDAMPIYVVGKQWMWSFAYPNGGGSNGTLYVPVGRPIRLVMTSRDVIHSFFVPEFRVKQDVIPGRTTTVWFQVDRPGTYRLFCTEYCGTAHSTMRGEVVALSPAEYDRQLEDLARIEVAGPQDGVPSVVGEPGPREPLSLAALGERVAATAGCLRCHTVDGTPHIGPTWAGLYGAEIPLTGGDRVLADDGYLTASMMDPLAQVHLGFEPVMPSYQGLLSAAQVGALVEFIRSLRDRPRREQAVPAPLQVPRQVPLVQPLPGADDAADAEPAAPAPRGPGGAP